VFNKIDRSGDAARVAGGAAPRVYLSAVRRGPRWLAPALKDCIGFRPSPEGALSARGTSMRCDGPGARETAHELLMTRHAEQSRERVTRIRRWADHRRSVER
jgi:beta-phosphoglucomutase-like phosphatase (HAD superfamily)